jgi:hypothetical protein
MPSVSRAQQAVMAIAEHDPSKLYARNRGAASMSHQQLHDFASTPTRGLPQHTPHLADGTVFQQREGVEPGGAHWMELVRAGTFPSKPMPSERAPMTHMQADGRQPMSGPRARRYYGEPAEHMADGHWIEKAFSKSGQPGHSLHATLHVPNDQPIPEKKLSGALNSPNLHTRRMAQLAKNANP